MTIQPYPPSLWMDQVDPGPLRTRVEEDVSCDVAVVGGGFTGLWTAYHVKEAAPDARVVVLEANRVGFGASGRNGGWCMADVAADADRWTSLAGAEAARRMERAMIDTIDRIEKTVTSEEIDCDWARSGTLTLARNPPQVHRLRQSTRAGSVWLEADEAQRLCGATRVLGALHATHDAVLHPAKLVHGLASACERRGVVIHEGSPVARIDGRTATTEGGSISADHVVIATEAYTVGLPRRRRRLVPFYARMIATEPLPHAVWESIRLHDRPGFADGRYRVTYGQRTADDRIAFGHTSSSYRFGSSIDAHAEANQRAMDLVHRVLLDLFPDLEPFDITHRWGGVLGVPRNWLPTVSFDRADGVHQAGGYVGEGVAASHLAGRCLAALIAETEEDVGTLPWIRRPSRRWPVEPFRWLGITAGSALFRLADEREASTGRRAWEADLVWRYLRR